MCAVVGLIDTEGKSSNNDRNLAEDAYEVLTALQHRGQDASGMIAWNQSQERFAAHKNLGLVCNVFGQDELKNLQGQALIGHNRYTTVGKNRKQSIQPMASGKMALAHNGNTVNIHELEATLQKKTNKTLSTGNDLESLLKLYESLLNSPSQKMPTPLKRLIEASEKIVQLVNGAYAMVGLEASLGLFGLRDPHGLRPLVLGRRGKKYCLASETGGLDFAGFEFVRDVRPGECIIIDYEGNIHSTILTKKKKAHCMFEWVYFAGAESSLEGKSVYQGRLELGRRLGLQVKKLIQKGVVKPDIIGPVPDTSRTAAMALSEVINVPYRECLIKNRYIQRSFILSSQKLRDETVRKKLIPIRSEIEGKNILLVDDSMVRGTTSRRIIRVLKEYGAKNVYLALTCPPIKYGCFYGIDFPSPLELIARTREAEDVNDDMGLGADKVIYLSLENLNEALLPDKMCMGCLTGKYPTNVAQGKTFAENRTRERERA